MARNWDSETDGDLLRFTRLESTRAEHILYATRIGRNTLLGPGVRCRDAIRDHPFASRQAGELDRKRRRRRRGGGCLNGALQVELGAASPPRRRTRSRMRKKSPCLRSPTSSKTSRDPDPEVVPASSPQPEEPALAYEEEVPSAPPSMSRPRPEAPEAAYADEAPSAPPSMEPPEAPEAAYANEAPSAPPSSPRPEAAVRTQAEEPRPTPPLRRAPPSQVGPPDLAPTRVSRPAEVSRPAPTPQIEVPAMSTRDG